MIRIIVFTIVLLVSASLQAQDYKEIRRSQLPEAVQNHLRTNYTKYSTSKIETKDNSKGQAMYRVTVHKKGKAFRLVLAENGAELDKVKLKSYSFTGPPEGGSNDAPSSPPVPRM